MGEERKSIPKSIRFEVLKRDLFTCQYCGRKAPEVILEIDHINPVANGGTNNILNLITSCRDCNRGKSKKLLSDNTAVMKQKKQADDLQIRREQLQMMFEWQEELLEESQIEVDICESALQNYYPGWELNDTGRRTIMLQIERFGLQRVVNAIHMAGVRYQDMETALMKIGGICYNRQKEGKDSDL